MNEVDVDQRLFPCVVNSSSIATGKERDSREIIQNKSDKYISKIHGKQQQHLELVKSSVIVEKRYPLLETEENEWKPLFKKDKPESKSVKEKKRDQPELKKIIQTANHLVPGAFHLVHEKDIVENDVLFQRGSGADRHHGNQIFRKLINTYQGTSSFASALKNSQIASMIVNIIMCSPVSPGRFLRKLDGSGQQGEELWYDIGYKAAEDETSQALREKNTHVHMFGRLIPKNIYRQPILEDTPQLVKSECKEKLTPSLYIQHGDNDHLNYKKRCHNEAENESEQAYPSLKATRKEVLVNDKQKPQKDNSRVVPEHINNNDVLLGQDRNNLHIGNVRFRQLVLDYQVNYFKVPKLMKASIARTLVKIIHNRGGRFLAQNDEETDWVEVKDHIARLKASVKLREPSAALKRRLLHEKKTSSHNVSYLTNMNNESSRFVQAVSMLNSPAQANGMNLQPFHSSGYNVNMMLNNKSQHSYASEQHVSGIKYTTASNQNNDHSSKKRENMYKTNVFSFSSHFDNVSTNDVLCGRGPFIYSHPGNVYFLGLVQETKKAYRAAPTKEKPLIIKNIVSRIQSLGGRFLKSNPKERKNDTNCQWTDVDDKKVLLKVGQALREKSTVDNG